MTETIERLLLLYETTPVLVAAYDGFDRLRYANAAFRAAYFIAEAESPFWSDLMRRNFLARRGTVITVPNFEDWLATTVARRGKTLFRAFETDLFDGRWLWMTESVQPDGWMLCIASDITSLRADAREVRQERDFAVKAASTDELTGAANRRFTMRRLEDMLQQTGLGQDCLGCVAILDLDNFKQINDRFGHQSGDTVLRDFAARIQGQLRRSDCFGRLGGEEFALILPRTPVAQAELILERMLATIRVSKPLIERPDFGYTFSAGISVARAGDTVADLYARADTALYAAKQSGRNCIGVEDATPGRAATAG